MKWKNMGAKNTKVAAAAADEEREREEEVFTARIGPELDRGRGDREHLSRCWNHQF